MELRRSLEVFVRHKWQILLAMVVVAGTAVALSALQEPMYQATTRVLLRPNDPAEQLYVDVASARALTDPDRYVSGQVNIIRSQEVLLEAGKAFAGRPPASLTHGLSVGQQGNSDVVKISATDSSPRRAAAVANAVARAYIESRRLRAVAGLQRAVDEVQVRLGELQTRVDDLDAQLAALGAGTPRLPQGAETPPTPESLTAAREAASNQYQSLYTRQQELLVNLSLKRGEAELISEARTPAAPISPKPVRNGVLGVTAGLMLGLGWALLREQLDDRVRSRAEVEHYNRLPVLAELPFDEEAGKKEKTLATVDHPGGLLAEAVRSLRSSLLFQGVEEPVKRLVVTSPGSGEGKSLVAANLAAAYAQAGFSTVLVSADLRRPSLDGLFAAPGSRGFTDVATQLAQSGPRRVRRRTKPEAEQTNGQPALRPGTQPPLRSGTQPPLRSGTPPAAEEDQPAGPGAAASSALERRALVKESLLPTAVPNLRFLPAGMPSPNPAELLSSQPAVEVLDEIGRLADVVVIDTPPILAVTDGTVLATKADGVILVNALRDTRRGAAQRARQTLESAQARVLGVVLNKTTRGSESSYYSSYYEAYDEARARPPSGTGARTSPPFEETPAH